MDVDERLGCDNFRRRARAGNLFEAGDIVKRHIVNIAWIVVMVAIGSAVWFGVYTFATKILLNPDGKLQVQ